MQDELFEIEARYPNAPGYKADGPSRDAARRIKPMAATIRGRVLKIFTDRYPAGFTADEAAKALALTEFTVRPRIAELHKLGLIEQTAMRRPNASGHNATVWRAAAMIAGAAR